MSYDRNIITGQGPYQKQNAFSELLQPVLAAALLVALALLVWLPAAYLLAVLADWLFAPALCGPALAVLFSVNARSGVNIRLRAVPPLPRAVAGVALVGGALPLYLRFISAWPWTWQTAAGVLWIGTPWGGIGLPAAWEWLRWMLVITLALALWFTGVELSHRLLMEIGAPNLANSLRAIAGRAQRRRWIDYPDQAEAEAQAGAPGPRWEGGEVGL